ncbi:hypothetical protein Dda_6389 [Drechslerella dactyloides]|uniref:Uncharacterized protein n=1 Tax=Drechslerella dactyloides TaxID=74499 RepID=A0AAD6IUP3_DREDA|nr:hypothetical protein Dda_6389 [Drechslerella dactyloides]
MPTKADAKQKRLAGVTINKAAGYELKACTHLNLDKFMLSACYGSASLDITILDPELRLETYYDYREPEFWLGADECAQKCMEWTKSQCIATHSISNRTCDFFNVYNEYTSSSKASAKATLLRRVCVLYSVPLSKKRAISSAGMTGGAYHTLGESCGWEVVPSEFIGDQMAGLCK